MTRLWTTRGTAQERRLPFALHEGYVLPFERSLARDIAALAKLGADTPFGETQRTWEPLFRAEPLVDLAKLLSRPFSGRLNDLHDAVARIGRLEDRDLAAALNDPRLTLSSVNPASAGPTISGKSLLKQLRPALEAAFERRAAGAQIDPALGLLLAQLVMLRGLKARMNQFPDDHVTCYYRQVLGLAPRPAGLTRTLLALGATAPVILPKGARFTGSRPGRPETVTAQVAESQRIVPAEVRSLLRLRYRRAASIVPLNSLGFITSVRADTVEPQDRSRVFEPHISIVAPPVGIRIESPMLALAEGGREIDIRLEMSINHARKNVGNSKEHPHVVAALSDPDIADAFGYAATPEGIDKYMKRRADIRSRAELNYFKIHKVVDDIPYFYELYNDEIFEDREDYEYEAAYENATIGLLAVAECNAFWCIEDSKRYGRKPQLGEVRAQLRAVLGRTLRHRLLSTYLLNTEKRWFSRLAEVAFKQVADLAEMPLPEFLVNRPAPGELFNTLFSDAFRVTLSTAAGPIVPDSVRVMRNRAGTAPGITFRLRLDTAAPAIATADPLMAPCAEITLASGARYCPVSFFEGYRIDAIDIGVSVEGMTTLFAYSDTGPLETSQTVLPFGPHPRPGAELLIGAPEIATKRVTEVCVAWSLADLPPLPDDGALDLHYAGYRDFLPPDPTVEVSFLNTMGWHDLAPEPVPLIRGARELSGMRRRKSVTGTIRTPTEPPDAGTDRTAFQARQGIGGGLVRLRLDPGGDGFGQETYPLALTEAIRRSRMPFCRPAAPNPPLLLKFSDIALDYKASHRIAINAPTLARPGDRVTSLTAFGTRPVFPLGGSESTTLFPQRIADGALFIGIGPKIKPGPISLLVETGETAQERLPIQQHPVRWQVHTKAGWQPLKPNALLSDGTNGLRTSGVVTLILPDETAMGAAGMPPGLIWLAATADETLDTFPVLESVRMNGVALHHASEAGATALPMTWSLSPALPAIAKIARSGVPSQKGRPAETTGHFRARCGEGLRHRQRGVTPWDIERLVLEEFPEVWKVKCFAARDGVSGKVAAGKMLVVVIPHPPEDVETPQPRMFDVLTLDRIHEKLADRVSPFATLVVRNPSFEQLQVRATVAFDQVGGIDALRRRLGMEISRRLTFWTAPEPLDGLGWSLDLSNLRAFIETRDYVRRVKTLQLIQLVHRNHEQRLDGNDRYQLYDSAAIEKEPAAIKTEPVRISYAEIWSLPIAFPHHIILDESAEQTAAVHAGIGQLAIGEALVVQALDDARRNETFRPDSDRTRPRTPGAPPEGARHE